MRRASADDKHGMRAVPLLLAIAIAHAPVLPAAETVVSATRPTLAADAIAATTVAWPAGAVALGAAVARLAVGGNRIELDPEVDAAAMIPMPAFSGTWWEAVDALAEAAGLELQPGAVFGPELLRQAGMRQEIEVPAAYTRPVLGRARPGGSTLVSRSGAVRLELHQPTVQGRTLSGRLLARVEPRLPDQRSRQIGLAAPGSRRVDIDQPDWSDPDPRYRLRTELDQGQVAPPLRASLVVSTPWSVSGEVAGGDTLVFDFGDGVRVTVQRTAQRAITVKAPRDLFGDSAPQLRVTRNGAQLSARGGSTSGDREGWTITQRYGELDESAVTVELAGRQTRTAQRIDLAGFSAARLGPGEVTAAALLALPTTQVRWAAGRRTLADALAALGGTALALGLGVDERRSADLPEFAGSWWTGVLAVCSAYRLRLSVGDNGALSLIPAGDAGAMQACAAGPLLVLVESVSREALRTAAGTDRRATIAFRILPEPREAAQAIVRSGLAFAQSVEAGGRTCVVLAPMPLEGPEQRGRSYSSVRIRHGGGNDDSDERMRASRASVTLASLPEGPLSVRLTGLAGVQLAATRDMSVPLRIGDSVAVDLGTHAAGISLLGAAELRAIAPDHHHLFRGQGDQGATLLLTGFPEQALDGSQLRLADDQGQDVALQGMGSMSQRLIYRQAGRVGPGMHTLRWQWQRDLGQVTAPVDLTVAIP